MHWSPKVFQWKQCEFPAASWSRKKVAMVPLPASWRGGPKTIRLFSHLNDPWIFMYYHHGVDRISTFQLFNFSSCFLKIVEWCWASIFYLAPGLVSNKKICSLPCRTFPSLLPPFQPSHHPKLHHSPESPWPLHSEKMGKGNEWPRLMQPWTSAMRFSATRNCLRPIRLHLKEAAMVKQNALFCLTRFQAVMLNAVTGVNLNAPTMVVMLISTSEIDPQHAENKPHHPFCLSKHWQMHVVRYCSPHRRPLLIQATSNSHSLIQHLSRYKTLIEAW